MKSPNFYASGPLDRVSHLRTDKDWISEQLSSPSSVLIPIWNMKNLVLEGASPMGARVPLTRGVMFGADTVVFLGMLDGVAHFAADFSGYEDPPLEEHGRFMDMRGVGQHLARDDGAMLVYARGAIQWHQRHRFCGSCGSPAESMEAGHMRKCVNPDCNAQMFPRIDPAVIMLVHDGGDKVVLGRQAVWPRGQQSVLAGFVEQGESLEDAVAREVFEEVGLTVADIHYHSSQPWPFPSSIMLGYTALATSEEMNVNFDEMDDAGWFTRQQVLDAQNSPETSPLRLPRADSISRRLITDWMNGAI
jgi:NAD+ diphosphatase